MKALLLYLMLTLVSANAIAGWAMVRGDDRFTLFVDYASIKKSGNKRLMWDLTDYKIVQIAASGGGLSVCQRSVGT